MTRFVDLVYTCPAFDRRGRDLFDPDRELPRLLDKSAFRLWQAGNPVPREGTFVLLGVATWSDYNMHLLDMLEEAMARPGDHPTVAVFNAGNLTSMEAIREYIPDCPD